MKIRNGFVSNSSSSSFLIISKNGELTKDVLMNAFDIKEGSPLYPIAKQMAKEMVDSCDKYTIEEYMDNYQSNWENLPEEEYINNFKEDYPEIYENVEKLKSNNNWKIYYGSADSCYQPALCEMELKYEDDNILIEKRRRILMNKLEAITYIVKSITDDSGMAFACVREILEDMIEPISKDELDKMIKDCNA